MEAWWNKPQVKWFTAFIVFMAAVVFVYWWVSIRSYVITNDARIATNIVRIAPVGVGGLIEKVYVEEGDAVSAGQMLVEIDHRVPEAQYKKAKAKFELSKLELERSRKLASDQYTSVRELDNARTNYDIAESEMRLTEVNLQNTYLKSPINGIVVQKLALAGNILDPGQVAVVISDVDGAWVSANIEETQVARVKTGQTVKILVDEGGTLTGKVQEINSATASQFSLLPSENASGNFTKLVQKIPVKITLDPRSDHRKLKAGQSVTVRIRTR